MSLIPIDPPSYREAVGLSKYPIGAEVAADVSEILDKAGIPGLLWGLLATGFAGRSDPGHVVEFVIPDACMEGAFTAVQEAGFVPCRWNEPTSHYPAGHPVEDKHFHFEGKYEHFKTLVLFPQSSTLWWLPDIQLGAPRRDDPHLTLSTNPQLPHPQVGGCSGPWTDLYPVKILNGDSLTDALILLLCRDFGAQNRYYYWWLSMLAKLMDQGAFPEILVEKNVRPEFGEFWEAFNADGAPGGTPLMKLRQRLIIENRLPPPPPPADGCDSESDDEETPDLWKR